MDIKHIKNLVQLMVDNDLSRLELREGETHILLRRGHPPMVGTAPVAMSAPATVAAPAIDAPASAAGTPAADNERVIRSPMVGTFYAAPEPESPPFVDIGDQVTPDTIVCLVEAMKVYNDIKAEVSGRITKVLAKNAQAVEYDQPLFAVAAF